MNSHAGTQTRATVLVVNDEPNVLEVMCRLLEREGYEVVGARDGAHAFELAQTVEPDVIISDVVMPSMDGLELCDRLKRDARTASVPLLLVSARRTDDDDYMLGLRAGADDYLELPFRRQELVVKVARLAERHAVERHYRNIFEQAGDIIYTSSPDGLITGINEAGARFFGRPAKELTGMRFAELFGAERLSTASEEGEEPPARFDVSASVGSEVSSASPSDASSVEQPSRAVYRVRDGRGASRYLEVLSTQMRDAQGQPTGVRRATARDVTERIEAEQRLNASIQQLQALTAELAQQAEREALINRITRAVRRSLDPAEVFKTAVSELGLHLDVDRCVLFMLDREAGVVRSVAEYVVEGVRPAGREYSIPTVAGLIEHIREHGVLAFDDAAGDERLRPTYEKILRELGTRSIMYAAIRVGEETPATFALSTVRELRHWRESDIALARAVADQTGIAIRQAELFDMVARAKQTWEATFDAMSDGIFIFDNERRLSRVNRAGAALEDAPPHSLLGRLCCDTLRATRSGTVETCIVEKALAERRAVTLEYMPERLERPLLVTAEPIFEQEGGALVGTVCTVRDLSELRQFERMARERQSLLENILESAREAIFALDTGGYFQWANGAAFSMGSYRRENLIGRHFSETIHEADRETVSERFARALEGEPQACEVRFLTSDNQMRYAQLDYAPLVIDSRITGVLGMARDITEQKQERERAAQADKLRALGQLASGVAHDFNNALAAILGRAQLMRRLTYDPEMTHSLDIIETAAEDAANTVRRIRTFARQSPGEQFELLELGNLLRDAVEITRTHWENEARARGLHYRVRFDAEPGLYTEGNASELREVFVNLIVNAVDAMPEGGELSIRTERTDDFARLLFTDDGTGMSEEVRERIFEPFYSTKGTHGTGLGLFVSYGIIERHRGRMSVESEVGHGTTFTVELPQVAPAQTPASERTTRTSAHALSILVVDDEPFVRDTLVEMLGALGHQVTAADAGRAALDALSQASFDLVFTDLSMPEMDGWEVAREIRRRFGSRLRVVVVTGHGTETLETLAERRLVDAVIAKPFNFEQVEEVIAEMQVGRRKAEG